MDQEKIGKFIKERRQELGLTQRQISDALGITAKAVSKWECGQNAPDISLLVDLSKILNVTTDEILNGCKDSEKQPTMDKATTRKLRTKTITEIILLILVLIITTATVFFGKYYSNNHNKCNIYKIYTQSTELEVTGYILSVNGKSSIILGNFLYTGSDDEKIIDYEVTLKLNDEIVTAKTSMNNKNYNLSDIFNEQKISFAGEMGALYVKNRKNEKTDIILSINYTNDKNHRKNKSYVFKIDDYYSN